MARSSPVALHFGSAHVVVYGNPAFLEEFGTSCIGLPAREALVELPGEAFDLLDTVFRQGKPYARWVTTARGRVRLTAVARRDPETGEVYGVAWRMVPEGPVTGVAQDAARHAGHPPKG